MVEQFVDTGEGSTLQGPGEILALKALQARRMFLSYGTHLAELYVAGEVTRPSIEKHPAYLAAEQFWQQAEADLKSYYENPSQAVALGAEVE